jgi:DNA repair protein RadA/Sms
MARNDKTVFECTACGGISPKWLGRCPTCGGWNSLEEVRKAARSAGGDSGRRAEPKPIADIRVEDAARLSTGLPELDRVLGGGLVPGAVVLLGGNPGIGKSTLLLQALVGLSRAGAHALYVSGEESAPQVALRARRMGVSEQVMMLAETELEPILAALQADRYAVAVIDSIQTMHSTQLESGAGSVAQLREVTAQLTEHAKRSNTVLLMIGHVTKDGALAGPKVLEHLVDTVLSFEGDSALDYRLVRVTKNRFGPSQEVGVFEMAEEGLREVQDPSGLFLQERPEQAAGSIVVPTAEGSRPVLVEVQALVAPAQYGSPRRVATGLDPSRVAVLLAVLQRKAAVQVLDQDVFANVAGGLRIDEPAVDLALCLAVVSSLRERPLANRLVAFGEVGLAGEVRAVSRAAARVAEAKKLGFERVLLPRSNAQRLTAEERAGIEVIGVANLSEALAHAF